jgi:hypothetical protein
MTRIFVIPLAIIIAVFTVPDFHLQFDTSSSLTTVTFIFTIVIGFFIASATSNYLGLQSLITQEDAALIDIFQIGSLVQPPMKKSLTEAIDRYLIACLECDFSNYVIGSQKEYLQLIETVNSIEPENDKVSSLIQNLHSAKTSVTQARQGSLLASRRVVKSIHWFILILLTLIIFVLLFVIRDQSLLSNLLIAGLAIATYMLLVLLYEIDANIFLEDVMTYADVEHVFNSIGKLMYYPKHAFNNSSFKPRVKSYRLGCHDSHGQLKIKIVR